MITDYSECKDYVPGYCSDCSVELEPVTRGMLEVVEEKIEKKQLKVEFMGKVLRVAGGDVKIKA